MTALVRTHTLPAAALGRYLIEGPDRDSALVGFHGYGENAEMHLEQLRKLPGAEGCRLVAVQALHRFYNNKTGEVVGCWMTRLDREQAILDNAAYVAQVMDALVRERPVERLVFIGFSQGVAMAWRAAARHPCQGLIALGGDMPPDVAQDSSVVLPPVLLGRGTRDGWYTEQRMALDLEALRARGAAVEAAVFEGGHEWGEPFFEAAGRFLARVGAR